MSLRYVCDDMRHLVCLPYSVANLHAMAEDLGIRRCWFHAGQYPHYDIPKRRVAEITARCELVSGRDILRIVKGQAGVNADISSVRVVRGDVPLSG